MVTYFKGICIDKETKKTPEAKFDTYRFGYRKTVSVLFPTCQRRVSAFLLLKKTMDWMFQTRLSFLFWPFALRGEIRRWNLHYNVPLQPIRVGETVILKNIFFDTDKYDLKEESWVNLQTDQLLQGNPEITLS